MSGVGVLASMMREHPWHETPLGPAVRWPTSLKTTLQIVLSSRFAMWMAWGKDLTFFCNDAYRPTLGSKQGWLGARSDHVWEEIWPDIGPRIDSVLATGNATWDEGLRLFLERSGFAEETYHTFSYSPLSDDNGVTNGMLCVVTEETTRVIGDRRLHVLRDLALRMGDARTIRQVWSAVADSLGAEGKDIPFAVAYRFDGDGDGATLTMMHGARSGSSVVPLRIEREQPGLWRVFALRDQVPFDELVDLSAVTDDLLPGPWDKPAARALMIPILEPGQDDPTGVFIAGINPYRPLDGDYRAFIELFVGQIASALVNANAFEAERKRVEALAEIDRAKTTFFSNVSHEFRTPLTLMLGPLEDALADTTQTARQRERIALAHRNGMRLLRLVNALLDFSRIESGRMHATFRPVDLSTLTAELASSFRSATDRAGIALIVDCPALSQPVFVDRDMWEMIVLNLVSNAFKFTFAGEIAVRLVDDGSHAALTVRDTGTGIAPDQVDRIFERFHRVEGAAGRSFEGSGIGLALVQELVHQHGGTISVQSVLGSGTTFTVAVPLGRAHLQADRVQQSTEAVASRGRSQSFVDEALRWLPGAESSPLIDEGQYTTPHAPVGKRRHVLVADDNADLRGYLRRLLEEQDYRVTTANDGVEALALAREIKPDLLITDVMMPKLDGFGLLSRVREEARLRDLPVIMLSARAGEEAQIEGLDAGADDYLTKPFSARELLARIAATLAMAKLRRETTAAIAESEARATAVLEGMAEGYLLVDRDFRILQINAEAARHFDGPAKDIVGAVAWRVLPDLIDERDLALLREAMSGRRSIAIDLHRPADGRDARWFELRAHPAGDGLALFHRDITDRKRAELSLQTLNETLESEVAQRTRERDRTWNNSQDLLIVIDFAGVIHAVNPAWSSVLGYAPAELMGTNVLDLVVPEDRERSTDAMHQAASGVLPNYENRLRHRDGSSRWIAWVATHEDDLIYGSGRNVSQEKEAALQLEATQAQLRQSQKMEAVGQLTGGLAHDFNNLLTGISGSLEMLQLRLQRGEVTNVDRYVSAAQGAARRAASLTHRLLAFSRRQTLDPRPTEVNRLVRDMEELIRRTVGPDIVVEVIGLSGAWTTKVDANQLENALLNLCINARDAMPHGGRLTIETANRWLDGRAAVERDVAPGQYLSLSVTDTGTGMTPEVMQRIFDPFFTTKPLGVGTGLGLSMVYGFARQSGGQVRVYSEVGSGTTMTMYLPRYFGDLEHEAPVEHRADPVTNPEGLAVLVVDDEATVRALVGEILGESGFRVIEAVDGAAGLRVLESSERIDLLITDVGLPGGINGRQVADAGRALRPTLKVLFITGYAENAVVGNGHLDPGMQILTKPFTMDALASRVDEMLRSR